MVTTAALVRRHLGKLPAVATPRILRLADYLTPRLATAPSAIAPWREEWPMFANDRLNNSPCVAAAHLSLHLTDPTSRSPAPTDNDVIALHTALTHGDPIAGNSNYATSAAAVLEHWRQEAFCGRRIAAYAALEPRNRTQAEWAIWLLGGIYCGLNLPANAHDQRVWSLSIGGFGGGAEPGSWGGHAVALVGYDHGGLLAVTWGGIQRLTWEFWREYSDETYALFNTAPPAAAQHGLDWDALQADTARLAR